jgi:L-amino acid N-acyltransferase YncA
MLLKLKNWISNFFVCEVHVAARLEDLMYAFILSDYSTRELNIIDEQEMQTWLTVVNKAYDENNRDVESTKKALQKHHFLDKTKTHVVINQRGEICATYSYGIYRNNPKVGGVFRLAVAKNHQGMGLGKHIILLGYQNLLNQGIQLGESVINSNRLISIRTHFSIGFKPVLNKRDVVHKDSHFMKNWVQYFRGRSILKKTYSAYLQDKKRKDNKTI